MKGAPYGRYSDIEYEDAAGYKETGGLINPQKYNGFPMVKPIVQSSDDDQGVNRSSLMRLKNSYHVNENRNLSQGSSPVPDWRRKMGDIEGQMRNTRWSGGSAGFPKSNYNYQEGPSNYYHGASNSKFEESPGRYNEYDEPKSFENLERDRAELLRKLNALEDQLVRSGSVEEQGKQRHRGERSRYHHESFGRPGDWPQENSSLANSATRMADRRFTNVSPYHENHPYNERHNAIMRESYLSSGFSNEIRKPGEHFESQIPRRGATSTPGRYQDYSPIRRHLPLQSADAVAPRMSGSPHLYNSLHQPDCSCFQCYNSTKNSSLPVQSRSPVNTRYTDLSSNPKLYHHKGIQLGFSPEISISSPVKGGQINHVRWPSALDSIVDEGDHLYQESTTSVKAKSSFYPIAGGAPFVTCSHCFELLQLRREIMKRRNQQQKIQCATCSSLTYIIVEGKKLVFSHKESLGESVEMRCGSNVDEAKENSKDFKNISNEAPEVMLHTRGPSQTSKSFHSDEFSCLVHEEGISDLEQEEHTSKIELEETKNDLKILEDSSIEVAVKTSNNHLLKNEDIKNLHSDDPNRSEPESPLKVTAPILSVPYYASVSNKSLDEQSLLSAVDSEDDNPKECATGQEQLANSDYSSDESVSPHHEHLGSSPSKHAVYWFGTHSQILRVKNEENNSGKSSPKTNLVGEISDEIETETEIQLETSKASSSTGSIGGSTFKDPPIINVVDSANEKIKANVLSMAMSIQYPEEKCDVRINEHTIPDHLVKKAEDLAGPILPGNYWYDFRAGFWGVTGGPCLGIIPPKIQQFNYPIAKNCSEGTTGVIVNGRELHKRDLALLHSRGLPIERGKSYIVDISGSVRDEISGEEFSNMGPLAPTIERLKRGFGMRASKN